MLAGLLCRYFLPTKLFPPIPPSTPLISSDNLYGLLGLDWLELKVIYLPKQYIPGRLALNPSPRVSDAARSWGSGSLLGCFSQLQAQASGKWKVWNPENGSDLLKVTTVATVIENGVVGGAVLEILDFISYLSRGLGWDVVSRAAYLYEQHLALNEQHSD